MMESDHFGAKRRNFWHFCTHKGLNQPKMARKQGNICQNMQKQGSFGVFLFRVQLNFFPVFWQGEFIPHRGGGAFGQNIYPCLIVWQIVPNAV